MQATVAAGDPERVQFENLARKVLIDPQAMLARAPLGALREQRIRADRGLIVEVQQHRRMARRGEQQVREAAEHPRPDRLALETAGNSKHSYFINRNGEVIGPKIGEVLEKRPLGQRVPLEADPAQSNSEEQHRSGR